VSHNDSLLNFSQFRLCNAFVSANEMCRNNVIFNEEVVDGLEVVPLVQMKTWS